VAELDDPNRPLTRLGSPSRQAPRLAMILLFTLIVFAALLIYFLNQRRFDAFWKSVVERRRESRRERRNRTEEAVDPNFQFDKPDDNR
jgi:hypothetical protein